MNCLHCNKPLLHNPVKPFCNRSCSTIHSNKNRPPRTEESKKKTSISVREAVKDCYSKENRIWYPRTYIVRKTCVICNIDFWAYGMNKSRNKTCSKNCASTNRSMNRVRKTHIKFIEPVTNRIVDLQSSWEESVAIHLNCLNILWSRPSKRLQWFDGLNHRTYLPDFYLPELDIYLDVKNPIGITQQIQKISEVQKQINLVVLELEPMKAWLETLSRVELDT